MPCRNEIKAEVEKLLKIVKKLQKFMKTVFEMVLYQFYKIKN